MVREGNRKLGPPLPLASVRVLHLTLCVLRTRVTRTLRIPFVWSTCWPCMEAQNEANELMLTMLLDMNGVVLQLRRTIVCLQSPNRRQSWLQHLTIMLLGLLRVGLMLAKEDREKVVNLLPSGNSHFYWLTTLGRRALLCILMPTLSVLKTRVLKVLSLCLAPLRKWNVLLRLLLTLKSYPVRVLVASLRRVTTTSR